VIFWDWDLDGLGWYYSVNIGKRGLLKGCNPGTWGCSRGSFRGLGGFGDFGPKIASVCLKPPE
jgi:hypothetical protein